MVIFVDESGIHKQTDHSTFALVYVTVDDCKTLEENIIKIEQRHRIKEFHWTDLPWKLREAFVNDITSLPFTAKVALFKNPIRHSDALEWALLHLLVEKHLQAIFLDGRQPRWVERKLRKVLRDKGISVKKLKTVRGVSAPGIRLADALAGVTRVYFDDPNGRAKSLWDKIQKKITTQLMGGQATR